MLQSLLESITLVFAIFVMGGKRNQLEISKSEDTEVEAI